MAIRFECPCGKHLTAPDGSEGRRVRCPVCRSVFRIRKKKARRRKRKQRIAESPSEADIVDDVGFGSDSDRDDDPAAAEAGPNEELAAVETTLPSASAKARILVADDDTSIIGTIKRALRERGYEVAVAHDGQEAVQMAGERLPDLAIIEVTLTKLNGFGVCSALKDRCAHLPVLMMTARRKRGDTNYSLSAKADGLLRKPFRSSDLVNRVEELLSERN